MGSLLKEKESAGPLSSRHRGNQEGKRLLVRNTCERRQEEEVGLDSRSWETIMQTCQGTSVPHRNITTIGGVLGGVEMARSCATAWLSYQAG